MVGDPLQTPTGYLVVLQRVNYPSWYGLDIVDVHLEVEFQSNSRLRLKVSTGSFLSVWKGFKLGACKLKIHHACQPVVFNYKK